MKEKTTQRLCGISGLLALLLPQFSFSQNELPDLGEPDEESLFVEEIPSVFGASKYEQRVSDAPASVSIITAEEIRKYGHRNLEDILDSVRGFYTTNDRNYGYLGIRGLTGRVIMEPAS